MKIQKILDVKGSIEVCTILATATLTELVAQVSDRNIGALLVTDEKGSIVGIVSERDVVHQCHKNMAFDTITVGDIMTQNVVTAHPEDDSSIAVELMVSKNIRHLPVISEGEIHGLITVRDLIHAMREADKDEVDKLVEYLQNSIVERECVVGD